MPYREVEMMPGLFLWRCDDCGSETPYSAVPRYRLGPAPHHDCPHAGRSHMQDILGEPSEAHALTVGLHLGDIVEDVASKRRGKIDNMSLNYGQQGQVVSVNYWRIFFDDGKQPLLQIVKERSGIRLVRCPHDEDSGGLRFVPERRIMD